MESVDIAVLTAKQEEFRAFRPCLQEKRRWPGTKENPNQYSWTLGSIATKGGSFRIVLGLTHDQTNTPAAFAAEATFLVFKPRYLIFMGIAGSLDRKVRLGDLLIADYVYWYEYGSISEAGAFRPRSQFQWPADQILRTSAAGFAADGKWSRKAGPKPGGSEYPQLHFGGLASGEKVVENASYLAPVVGPESWLRAVEMEGAGVAQAVQHLRDRGHTVGFMVLRGISDMPIGGAGGAGAGASSGTEIVAAADGAGDGRPANANRETRKQWTDYAAKAASVFLKHFIKSAFPYAPAAPIAEPEDRRHLDPGAFTAYTSHFIGAHELPLIHTINRETYNPSVLIPTTLLEAWWRANPFMIRLVRNSMGEAVGYWNIVALRADTYQALVEGRILERDIRPEQICPYHELERGSVFLYIGAISARAKMQPSTAAVILDCIAFLELVHQRIGIDRICAQIVSPEAVQLAANFGMTRLHERNSISTWVADSHARVENALKHGRQELRNLKGLTPKSSRRERLLLEQLFRH
jgi:nucleoside phosphorylase